MIVEQAEQTTFKNLQVHGGTPLPNHGESTKNNEAGSNEYRVVNISYSKSLQFIYLFNFVYFH